MTGAQESYEGNNFLVMKLGGSILAMGMVWVSLGWLASGYPDGVLFVILTAGGMVAFAGGARSLISSSQQTAAPLPDELP